MSHDPSPDPRCRSGIPALVLIPGTLCDRRLFSGLVRRLRPDVRVLNWDWRELLGPRRPGAADATEPVNVLAFSLGGIWVLNQARRARGHRAEGALAPGWIPGVNIERLALVASNAEAATPTVRRRVRMQRGWLRRGGGEAVARIAKSQYFGRRRPFPWQRRLVLDMARRTPRGIARRQLQLARERSDSREAFRDFPGPVAVLGGRDDRLCPPRLQRRLLAERADAHARILPRCGHMIPLESPGRLALEIRRWLRETSSFQHLLPGAHP